VKPPAFLFVEQASRLHSSEPPAFQCRLFFFHSEEQVFEVGRQIGGDVVEYEKFHGHHFKFVRRLPDGDKAEDCFLKMLCVAYLDVCARRHDVVVVEGDVVRVFFVKVEDGHCGHFVPH